MSYITRLFVNLGLLISLCTAVSAQKPVEPKPPSSASVSVAVSLTDAGLRFTALGPVRQTRLEVFDAAGASVFDSGFLPGGVRNWSPQQAGQTTPVDGAYQCVLTARDLSGRLSLKQGAIEVTNGQVALRLGDAEGAGDVKRHQDSLSPMDGERPALAITAHDGRDGHVVSTAGDLTLRTGDFFSGKDKEQMRITEDGRVGIGTDKPEATLDVAGTVRVSEGVRFSDGTTLDAANGKLTVRDAKGDSVLGLKAAGTGTINRLAKWAETGGAGTLTDSQVTETAAGLVGIGTPTPQTLLQVGPNIGYGATTGLLLANNLIGSQYDRAFQLAPRQTASPLTNSILMYALPTVNTGVTVPGQYGIFVDGKQGAGAITSYAAIATGQTATLGASNNTHLLLGNLPIPAGNFAIYDHTNYKSYFRGNVGIGTSAPLAKLDIAGGADYDGSSDTKALAFSYRGGGFRHWVRTRHNSLAVGGNAIDFFVNNSPSASASSAPGTGNQHVMSLGGDGKVGIGTIAPQARLHVNTPSSPSPMSGMAIDVQSFQTPSNALASHYFRVKDIGSGSPSAFYIRGDGNVGVGTETPAERLSVAGRVESTSGGFKFPDGTVQTSAVGTTYTFYREDQVELSDSGQSILYLNLPPGTYLLTATANFFNNNFEVGQDRTRNVHCRLTNQLLNHSSTLGASGYSTMTLHTVLNISSGIAELNCVAHSDTGRVFAEIRRLTAVKIDNVVVQ